MIFLSFSCRENITSRRVLVSVALLLALARIVTLGFVPHGTHDRILSHNGLLQDPCQLMIHQSYSLTL
jgi:hypothetical protein